MNKREIVIETLGHKRSARVPYNIDFTTAAREKLREYLGLATPEAVGSYIGNYFAQLNIGSVTGPSDGTIPDIYPRKLGEDTYIDDWGVVWQREPGDDIGVVIGSRLEEPDLKGFEPPVPASRARWLSSLCATSHDQFRLVSLSSPVFQRAWFLRGFEDLLVDMAIHDEFVHQLMDVIVEYTTAVVREAVEYDIDGFFLMDDWGQQEGLIISPGMWREYIKPRMQTLFEMVKERDLFVFFHSCGDIEELIPELIEMGVDVLNPFQPEVMDVYAIKEQFGDRLSFYGGVSTQELLPHGTPQEVEADVRDKMEKLGHNGGYILAPAHAVQADVPIENILALIRGVEEQ